VIARLSVFVLSVVYFLLYRDYGFQLEDEGTLLLLLDRALHGQRPYLDFHTGYTPGFYYLGTRVFALFGESTTALRTVTALLNACSATALYELAVRACPGGRHAPRVAWLAPLAWVAFLPVYRGEFASFNVPYPAWVATFAWLLLALCLDAWRRRGGGHWLVAAGGATALAFAVKPNAGAFAGAAAVLILAMSVRSRTRGERALSVASCILVAAGVWYVFGLRVWGSDAAIHLTPLAVLLVMACGPLAGRFAAAPTERPPSALALLGSGFAIPTLLWVIPTLTDLGIARFSREVLLIGSAYSELYYVPHPAPGPYALVTVVAAVALAVAGRAVAAGRLRPLPWLAAAGAAAALLLAYVAAASAMPESFAFSVTSQLENAAFWLCPLAHAAGLGWLARAAIRPTRGMRASDDEPLVVIVPAAIAMYWQVYPRSDFMHVISSAPLTIVLATCLLARVVSWWAAGDWTVRSRNGRRLDGARIVEVLLVAAAAVVIALEVGPVIGGPIACATGAPAELDTERVHVCIEPERAEDLRAMASSVGFLRANTKPGEPVLAFPALGGLLFAAGLTSPVPHDYWWPGRPDHADEARMREMVERAPPRLVVALNDGWSFFAGSPSYFRSMREPIVRDYRLAARFGRFDILARRDIIASLATQASWQPPAAAEGDIAEADLVERRQAVRGWLASLDVQQAARAELPAGERDALLELRALRDGGDLRATGWLIRGYGRPEARVRAEAAAAMAQVTSRYRAARYRWADDVRPQRYAPFVTPYRDQARRLADDPDPRVSTFARLVLAVAAGQDQEEAD